jgi:DNA-binding IclR family transcriptional regulator
MTFGRAVVLERIRPGEDADFRQYVTLEAKILPALEKGPATAEKLASELGEKPGSVKNALTKLKSRGLVQPVGKDVRADVYALSVTSSHPIYSDDDVTKLVEAPAPWEGPYDS